MPQGKSLLAEFRTFIMRGNIIDLAVAVIIGTAFGAVVKTFANGIVMNFIAAIFNQPDFSAIAIHIRRGNLLVGEFLNALVNFLVIAAVLFVILKSFESLQQRRRSGQVAPEEAPAPTDETVLLAEIRDLLRAQRA